MAISRGQLASYCDVTGDRAEAREHARLCLETVASMRARKVEIDPLLGRTEARLRAFLAAD